MKTYIIKNARLVDGTSTSFLVENGWIKKIGIDIEEKEIPVIELEKDSYLSAGWIDMHTHCFQKFEMYKDDCDEIGYKTGVTTVVDAGTAGAEVMGEFYQEVQSHLTNVYAFINICKKGIFAQNELEDLNNLDIPLLKECYKKYSDFIVGIKVRSSKSVVGSAKDEPLDIGIRAAKELDLPLMIHIGTAPSLLETVVEKLRPRDIITHIFNPKENGICLPDGSMKPCINKAIDKGIYLDIGHGIDSFSFKALDVANKNHIKADTISTDIYSRNRVNGPVYDLATTMSKFIDRGYILSEIIDKVTKEPAKILGLHDIGELEVGKKAEFTIFKIVEDQKEVVDSAGVKEVINKYIQPIGVILKDEYRKLGEA
ncbi:MAG: amidohydrolase/deacetylase family metallohydrolase [Coprobacillaceae bacterium]